MAAGKTRLFQFLILLLVILSLHPLVNAQQLPQPYWQRAYGGYGDDEAVAFTKTFDKGFVIVGYSYSSIDGDVDTSNLSYEYYAWVTKLDSARNIVWQRKIKRVGYVAQEVTMKRVIQTRDSGIVVLGAGDDDNAMQFCIKFDKNGKQLWKYAPPTNGLFTNFAELIENPDGKLVICGYRTVYRGNDFNRGWLIFLNPDGSFNTEKLYQSPVNIGMQFTTIDRDFANGGYILGGTHDSLNGNVLIVKLAADTSMTWYRSYGGRGFEYVRDILLLPDNTYMVATSTTSNDGDVSGNHCNGGCPEDVWLLKITQSGDLINKMIIGDFDNDRAYKLVHYKGGVFMVGYSNSYLNSFNGNLGGYSIWTTQLDYHLNRISAYGWYGGPYSDIGVDVAIDSTDGQIYPIIMGTTAAGNGSQVEGHHDGGYLYDTDVWLFKLGLFNTIKGIAFIDYNKNGLKDGNEPFYKSGVFTTYRNGDTLNSYNQDGTFRFKVFQNSYNTRLTINDTAYQVQPAVRTSTFTNYFNTDSIAFILTLRPGFSDISMSGYAVKTARAGFETLYEGILTNRAGDTVRNKQVVFLKDKKLTYVAATPTPSRVSGDSIIWNYALLRRSDTGRYSIRLKPGVPPQVQLGDTLKSYFLAPLTTDSDTTNNIAPIIQTIIGSYDPNDKNEMHNGELQASKAIDGEFLTYIIRFQNTGNASAINVIITDTLDAQLNASTLEILKTSHPGKFSMNNNKLQWVFQNIYLPDSTTNEPGSHGHIAYRIKTKKNIVANSFVNNRAAIYFDYNPPVITASARTLLISAITGMPGAPSVQTRLLKLFPNPAMPGSLFLAYDGNGPVKSVVEIFSSDGRLISSIPTQLNGGSNATGIKTGGLPTGFYFIKITAKNINETHPVLIVP
jgi:uncharacterized repeat protein (TIGR01451 family)